MEPANPSLPADDVAAIDRLGAIYKELSAELSKVIIGQQRVVELLSIALFSRGHALLMGVPGLAKTLLISSVARTLDLSFNRIQFTPDLMPADITGTDIIQDDSAGGKRQFEFIKGPVFANIVLADEINRAPAKTQSALLEAMQERRVTVMGRTFTLLPPFFVLATQNPIEQEGTYPLPEAQLDRFFFQILIKYPDAVQEVEILRRTGGFSMPEPEVLLNAEQVIALQNAVTEIPVPDHVYEAIVRLVQSTRPESASAPDYVKSYLAWGAGPRAPQCLLRAARALALLRGQTSASVEEVREVMRPVLRHRLIPNYNATGEGVSVEDILGRLQESL